MKKLLIACAALGLSLGGANAMDDMAMDGPALSLTGSAGMGLNFTAGKDNTDNQNRTSIKSFVKVVFKGEGVTDGGLTFGSQVRVRTDSADKVDDGEVYIKGEMWEVRVGAIDPASDMAETLDDVGFDGDLGVDDLAEGATPDTAAGAIGKFTLGPATVGVSAGFVNPKDMDGEAAPTIKQKNEWAIGATFVAGPATIGVGVDSGPATGMGFGDDKDTPAYDNSRKDYSNAIQASVKGGFGGFTGVVFVSQQEIETTVGSGNNAEISTNKVMGLGGQVTVEAMPGTNVTAVYTQQDHSDPDETHKGFGLGVKHQLGGGAEVQAGFAQVKDQDKASVGVVMSF